MPMPRLLVPSLLLIAAACASPEPRSVESDGDPNPEPQRLKSALARECRDEVARHGNAVVTGEPRAALMREDWVQVDGTMEWRGPEGVLANAWTCDMFRNEAGVWERRYLSFGPVS
jgi:hypothetical protein